MKLLAAVFLFTVPLLAHGTTDIWAQGSAALTDHGDFATWQAPGNEASIHLGEGGSTLKARRSVMSIEGIFANVNLAEVGWSPRLHGVFLNASDGGEVGTWGTRAFVIESGKARELPVARLLKTAKALTSDCDDLNVMSVAWLEEERALLVLEQVPNSSGCSNMNRAALFVVDVATGKVREKLSPEAARTRYARFLGEGVTAILTQLPNK